MTIATEIHISSAVVHCKPEIMNAVIKQINDLDNTSVEAQDKKGKLVVLLETESERSILDNLTAINGFNGVLGTHLVYHQID